VPEPNPRLSITSGSLARAVVLVAGWLVVMTVLMRARGPLVLFVFGFVTAAIAYPAVGWLGRRMPRWIAIVLVSLLAAGLAGVVGARIYDEVNRQARDLASAVDEAVTRLEESERYGDTVERLDLRERADQFTQAMVEDVSFSGSRLTELAPSLASGAGDVFVIWLFAVMLLATGPQFVRSFVALFPSPVTQRRVRHVIVVAHARSARFIGLCALRAVGWFVVVLVVAELLDLRVPTFLALVVGVLSFLPRFGLVVGAIPMAVVAALRSPDLVLPVLLAAVLAQLFDAVVLQNHIERRSVSVGSLSILVFAVLGWSLEGTWGLILGVIGSAFAMAAIDEGLAIRDGEVPDPGGAAPTPQIAPPLAGASVDQA
jgi:predicted PurR-regulated permease PerM